jgi:hypothetical protein
VARSLLIVSAVALGFALASPAGASDLGAVRCSPNSDRVWVYQSLNSFDVETRLKCGDTVEILSRVKGYVKIRTASGVEGYVPDAAFPDLPALPPDDADRPVASVAMAARAASSSAPVRVVAMPPPVAPMAPPAAAPPAVTVSQPPSVAANPAAAPASVAVAEASAPPAAVAVRPASAVTAASRSKSHEKNNGPTVVAEPAAPKKTPAKPAPSNTQSAKLTITAPQPSAPVSSMAPATIAATVPAMVPAKADLASDSSTMNAAMMDATANASPKADIIIHEPARDPDLEEYPDSTPENASADPACRVFFSAYGLAPAQYKWLVESRHKEYAGICPAPDLARVDYVILFAHDSDAYTDAMPSPVHTDRNGFSDFSPLTTVDTALLSESALDKARYEFVWVFHTRRGTFDPSKFSARRRPLFTTDAKGSHASARAVEDAFHFIGEQGSPDR